jgi:fructose 1,6-bisphosphatase
LNDSQIRAMVSYVVGYMNKNCPENLEIMIHLIGHDEEYRKRVSEITEAIINHHDELFVSVSSGKKIEEITPKYAEKCDAIRIKMRKLVDEYLSNCSEPN